MDPGVGEALPQVPEQRFESSDSLAPSHGTDRRGSSLNAGPDRFERLDERMDQIQDQVRATHAMVRELTLLMHRQVKMTATKDKSRSLSENDSPSNYAVLTTAPSLRSLALGIVSPSSLVPADGPGLNELDHEPRIRSQGPRLSTLQRKLSPVSAPPEYTPPPKKVSVGIAVLSAEITALRKSLIKPSGRATKRVKAEPSQEEPTREVGEAKIQVPQERVGVLKAGHGKRKPDYTASAPLGAHQEGKVTRRFSVSVKHLAEPAKSAQSRLARMSRMFIKGQRNNDATVSPEEILSARNLDMDFHPLTLRHDSQYRSMWDVLVMIMVLLDVVFTPLTLGFDYTPHYLSWLNTVGTVLFVIDFVVHLFSSYTNLRGELISGPKRTIKHYLLSWWALPDFLSWFPFEHFASADQGRFFGFSKAFRLAKVSQLARRLHSAKKAGILRFIRLLGVVLVVVHVLACYWHWVAVGWRENQLDDQYAPQSLIGDYAVSWAAVVGCLNASPPHMHTVAEQLSVATFMLLGNVLQASVFGSVAVLISSFDEDEAAYNKKIIATSERCRFLGIPDDLTRRIRGYYENLWRETKSISSDADAFINELSPALICEVKFQLYRDMLKQIPFLSTQKLAPALIEMLILHLRTVIYMQDDVLIRKGEFGDWMGFIGSKGSVGVLDPASDSRKIIRILRKGDYFGEMALLQRAKRSTTAVALTWVQIHVLCRNDLDTVKAQYPTQTEILEEEITKYMQSKVHYK